MLGFEGYRFVELLSQNDRIRVVRSQVSRDGGTVILKQLRRSPRPDNVAWLEQELTLIQSLDLPGVVRARGLLDVHGEPTLVLDDPGGSSLEHTLSSAPIAFEKKLDIALRLTSIVGTIHRSGVVHRGLQPSGILWNSADDRLTLIDFNLATRATRDLASSAGAGALVGTPHYISPEQTGRLGMVVDRRSDLYSLGATLYRLFSGRPPFEGQDIAALLHAHVARVPERADAVMPGLPPILASILEKSLRKDPDDRYQTATGLETDLRRVLAGERDFVPGASDAPNVLRVREALVGRELEVERLKVFTGALTAGPRAIAYVSGEAGVGKSALLLVLGRSVVAQGGLLARGKFDLAISGTPYHGIAQILAELSGTVLALPDAALEALRDRLDASMRALAPALVEVFPVVRPVFREVPELVAVPPVQSRHRLVASFVAFIGAIAPSHVMTVLVVDDLQWADVASLTLLEALTRDASLRGVGLVVAARDNEVLPGSPVARFIAALDATGAAVEPIRVSPLPREAIAAILADSLHATPDRVERLSHVIWRKTQGNPFFLRTLLESAIDRGFVRYESGFVWDDAAIEESPVAEDIATLLARKLGDLPGATRDALAIAARIGDPIEGATVARMLGVSDAELLDILAPAVEGGLLFRADGAIRFVHDRLVEASLALVPDERAREIHARLSALMLERNGQDRFFEAVDHLWLSGDSADHVDRARRSTLALAAATRAHAARAFEAAEAYFERYAATMDPFAFERAFEATFEAHLEWAEAAYLAGRYERAEQLLAELEGRARNAAERLRVRRTLINFYEKTYRFVDAIRLSFATLADVGVALPSYDVVSAGDVDAEIGRFLERLDRVDRSALLPCKSGITSDAIAMLVAVAVPLWSARPEALPLVLARAGVLSLDEGFAPPSGAGLVLLGSMLCLTPGTSDAGVATAKLGLLAQERFGNPDYECLTLFAYNAMVQLHFESAELGRAGLLEGFHRGIAVGNRQWASYCADQYPLRAALIGLPLPTVREDVFQIQPALLRLEQEDSITHAEPQTHFVERILEQPETPWNLGARRTDGATALAYLRESKHRGPILLDTMFRMLECLVGGDETQAYAIARSEEALIFQPTGQLQTEFALVLFALSAARGAPPGDAEADAAIARVVARFAQMSRFEATSFGGYHALVEAGQLERAGSLDAAAHACDRAIDVFERDRTLHLLGIANELAARVHRAAGRGRISRFYLRAARLAYERWGAPGPVRRLDAALGVSAAHAALPPGNDVPDTRGIPGTEPAPVDVVSLLKAARVIASEIEVDRLITTLLKIVAENAGANRAHLFLEREGSLALEARCDADLTVVRVRPGERQSAADAPLVIATLVARTREPVVLDGASLVPQVAIGPYLAGRGRVAVLAAPIERHGRVVGVVVLENDLVPGAFTRRHAEVVSALNAQIAVALENAALYDELRARAASLASSNERLHDEVLERERAERALGESETMLRHMQKMEAIGLLAGGIAHDFGNLLSVISTYTAMMLEKLSPSDPSRELVEGIQHAGEFGAVLTRQLLTFSRRQVVTPKDVALGTIVRDLAPMLSRILPGTVRLEVGGDDGDDLIHADRGQIEQVVLNLIVNARDAMPDGGTIRVDVVGATHGRDRAQLRVRDEGIGMDDATRSRIFEPFFTTKGGGRGTGLGLSTVYGITTEAGGTIDVQTAPGEGTTFELSFPVVGTVRADLPRTPTASQLRGAEQRVLVVDDDPAVRTLTAGILTSHGYNVTTASDGAEAFAVAERFERSGQALDLVLTDFVMPGGSGREFVERLRTIRPSVPVLYMSAYTNDAILRHLARNGEVSILEKPFTPIGLLERVHEELARTRSMPEPGA